MVKYYQLRHLNKWLVAFDKKLVPFPNKLLTLIPLTVIYALLFGFRDGLLLSLSFAAYTLWNYISIRKYGWMDTLTFQGVLPFMLIGAAISRFNNDYKNNKPDPNKFAPVANSALTDVINDVYEGKIIDTAISTNEVRFTVETPFGISLPLGKILPAVATSLHVPVSDISHIDLTDRRSYYSFNLGAVRAFEHYDRSKYEYLTLSGIKERLLCRLPKGANQI